MSVKKFFMAAAVLFLAASLAAAQSLVEATKKEKERRESLKGKLSVVVTNTDLSKTKKKPAVAVTSPETPAEGESTTPPDAKTVSTETTADKDKPGPDLQAESRKKYEEKKSELEEKSDKTKERVELLNLKMSALWQRFYSFNSMTPKDQIQKEISETFQKLQAAKADETKAKEELDKFLALGPEKFSPAGIK